MKRKRGVVAWKIEGDGEGHGMITFARTRGEARQTACSEWGLDYIEAKAWRAPEFDDVEKLTQKAYIDRGWWFECGECSTQCSLEMDSTYIDDDESEIECDGPVYDEFENVFCSKHCLEKHLEWRRRLKEKKEWAIRYVGRVLPCAIIKNMLNLSIGRCHGRPCYNDCRNNIVIEFEIPGVDYCTWPGHDEFCAGCRHFYLSRESMELFAAFRSQGFPITKEAVVS